MRSTCWSTVRWWRCSPREDDGAPRYRLLESPRAYALERLERGRRARGRAAPPCAGVGGDVRCRVRRLLQRPHRRRRLAAPARAPTSTTPATPWRWARAAGDASVELRIGATMLRALPPSLHAERMALADALRGAHRRAGCPSALQQRAWIELSCALADTQKLRSRDAAERALALARALDRPAPTASRSTTRCAARRAPPRRPATCRRRVRRSTRLQRLEDPAWPAQRLLWGAEAAQWVARISGDAGEALRRGRRLLALDRERGSHGSIALGNLIDAELAAGDAAAPPVRGRELVAVLRGHASRVQPGVCAHQPVRRLLAQDDCARRRAGRAGGMAAGAGVRASALGAAYLALLARLEGRPRTAARLLGYAEAIYAAARRGARDERGALRSHGRRRWRRRRSASAAFDRLHAEGATLGDIEVTALAFGEGG